VGGPDICFCLYYARGVFTRDTKKEAKGFAKNPWKIEKGGPEVRDTNHEKITVDE
jgi:hypothetical protein